MERVCIFIDSGNFYHLVLKKLGLRDIGFNFERLALFLAGGREIAHEGKRFYVGSVRERHDGHESKTAMENQTKLFSNLITAGNWAIKTSKLRTRIEKLKIDDRVVNYRDILRKGISEIEHQKSREKGIDVKMAVDLMVGAIDAKYDTAIVVSSDTDLIPAIDWIRKRVKKKVEYIGFSIPYANPKTGTDESTRPTKTMIYNSDVQRVLVESDLKPFIVGKVILVDAVDAFVIESGGAFKIFEKMRDMLEAFPNRKILLTGANDEQFKEFNLGTMPYEVFTLKHEPEKTDPQYYELMLKHLGLSREDVIYFEHNQDAVKSAQSVGIKTHYYDPVRQDLIALKTFLIENL